MCLSRWKIRFISALLQGFLHHSVIHSTLVSVSRLHTKINMAYCCYAYYVMHTSKVYEQPYVCIVRSMLYYDLPNCKEKKVFMCTKPKWARLLHRAHYRTEAIGKPLHPMAESRVCSVPALSINQHHLTFACLRSDLPLK